MQQRVNFKWIYDFSSVKRVEFVLVRERKCGGSATRTTAGNLTVFAEDLTIPAK